MAIKKLKIKLLVAVDFTSYSKKALFFASKLADCLGAQLLVLHIIHDPAEAPGFYARKGKKKKYLQSMEEAADEMMKEFLNEMRKAHPDQIPIQNAKSLLVVGTPVSRIIEIAEKKTSQHDHPRKSWTHGIIPSTDRIKSRTCCSAVAYPGHGCKDLEKN